MKAMKVSVYCFSVLLVLCLVSTVSAKEIKQGTIEISGDLDVSSGSTTSKPEGGSTTTTDTQTVSSTLAYYVIPNLGIGLDCFHESSESKTGSVKAKSTTNIIGPIVIYNISANEHLSIVLAGAVGKASLEYSSGNTYDGFAWVAGGGLRFFLNDNVALNALASYLNMQIDGGTPSKSVSLTGFNMGLGISVFIK